jgi:ABC-type proline/glycine betaine transport system permease subunit
MKLKKINEILNKGMIGIFISIIPLSLLALLLPVVGYVIGFLLYALMFVTCLNFILSTYLFIKDINDILEQLIISQYEQGE